MIHYCISVPKALHSIQFMESGSEQGDKSRNTICMEEAVTSFSLSLLYSTTLPSLKLVCVQQNCMCMFVSWDYYTFRVWGFLLSLKELALSSFTLIDIFLREKIFVFVTCYKVERGCLLLFWNYKRISTLVCVCVYVLGFAYVWINVLCTYGSDDGETYM